MLLEEVIPYVRKGHKATFKGREVLSILHELSLAIDKSGRMFSDEWGYLPKYTGLVEAIEALRNNKTIVADETELEEKVSRRHFRLRNDHRNLLYWHIGSCSWETYSTGIPLCWLGKNNFEVLED